MDTIQRVYNLIDARHISLYELTKRSGISYSTIKAAEKRGCQLRVDTIERLCGSLGITLSEFFSEAVIPGDK